VREYCATVSSRAGDDDASARGEAPGACVVLPRSGTVLWHGFPTSLSQGTARNTAVLTPNGRSPSLAGGKQNYAMTSASLRSCIFLLHHGMERNTRNASWRWLLCCIGLLAADRV
jgi:hypothetical protein